MAKKIEIENLQDLIKDSIGGELMEQKAESLLPPGENFGSVMYKVDFKVKKDGKTDEYHAVAKCTPQNPLTQKLFNIQVSFKSEIAWYTTIIPTLREFQRKHGIKKEIDFFQPFYGSRINLNPTSDKVDLDGVILTQHLKYLGYHSVDRHIGFDLATTYIILRDLATFHAVPLAVRIQNPELFDKKIKANLSKISVAEEMKVGFNEPVLVAFNQIPELKPYVENIKKRLDEANIFEDRPLREPWVTVMHLDLWMNNIMVTGGDNPKIMILDLQATGLGSPAADLVFFLLTSVKFDIIKEKYDDFVKFYYGEFIKNLEGLNVSTENFTFDGLLQEIDTEMRRTELAHILSWTVDILNEKGKTNFDSSNTNFKIEDLTQDGIVITERHVEKFKWIAPEAVKRKWL